MKKTTSAFAFFAPLALIWACGSSGEGDNGGGAANGTGATAATGATLGMGGEGSIVGGENSGATTSTGGTTSLGGNTNTGGSTLGFGGIGTSLCGDEGCACSNGTDDDGDELADGLDPECTGPFDDDEGTFGTGISGDNVDPKWQDCFFDGNSGAGDDRCRYATECLTGDLPSDHKDCTVTQDCLDFCGARTPNGCDCFGCCTVEIGGGETVDIMTSNACSVDNIDDEEACPRCTKTEQCGNTCGTCELCPGKTVEDLPEECDPDTGTGGAPGSGGTGGGPGYTCDGGEQVCGVGLPECEIGTYCALGCCIVYDVK